ncbi:MAG: response regulator [Desulfococcaceae bacterium]|jgi:DNA-binding response OmpR family regulator|nr:response regulator [Desulfococcaceae bacterium]
MKKIMIVDDKPEVRKLVEMTLRVGDYRVIQAESGGEAVVAAKKEKPDLIIMDVMMPGEIDGLEAVRRIRQTPECGECRIIMLTAKGQQSDRQVGYRAGADAYFVKPFSPLELIRRVEDVLSPGENTAPV